MLIRPKSSRILFLLVVFALPAFAVIPQDNADAIAAERHYKRGQKLYRTGQTEQAIEELYTALSVREIYYEAQLLLGRSLIEAKRYREAAATLREIEPPERGAAEVHKLLGRAYYQMNRLREAARNLHYAIRSSKRPDYELHYLLGLVMLRQGDAEGAIVEATRAAALKPRFAPARKLLSDAYLMKKDYEPSEKALKHYLASVRDGTEAAEIKERIEAIRSLGRAKPEKSVQKPITLPQIYKIPHPGYTLEALRYNVEGSVRLEVLLGSDGAIKHALVVRGLGFGLDEEALKAARGIKFKPGEVDGQPVSMWMGVELGFMTIEIERKRGETPKIALSTAGLIHYKGK
ncbi:MAG: TonB family protein [Acidobacteria bacterium]|nr:TonB family protein [Acidobacteriota bacterium]